MFIIISYFIIIWIIFIKFLPLYKITIMATKFCHSKNLVLSQYFAGNKILLQLHISSNVKATLTCIVRGNSSRFGWNLTSWTRFKSKSSCSCSRDGIASGTGKPVVSIPALCDIATANYTDDSTKTLGS